MKDYNKLIFELSKSGRKAYRLPALDVEDVALENLIPEEYMTTKDLNFPELSEFDVVRHYTNLSNKNYGLDTGFYPLGSCTMKYNPKINEDVSRYDGFVNVHPLQPESTIQGSLRLMYELEKHLSEIGGMDRFTLQPAAGAQGELTGMMLIKAYHEKNKDFKRDKIIVPDSAHGTNPATAAMVGYEIIEIKSTPEGLVDLQALKAVVGDDTAGLMLTNPNTLGIYDKGVKEISRIVHEAGGLLYYDGANLNGIMGNVRPGDMGFDVVHYNIHKTLATPHGGGGPGSGPVGCKEILAEFLPVPVVKKREDGSYYLDHNLPDTIGKVKDFYGHFGVFLKAFSYILTMGSEGLKQASKIAVLNTNYIKEKLKDYYDLPLDVLVKHEVVFSGLKDKSIDVTTFDIVKRMMDKGYHPPTVYFPLIIDQAMMFEPTETESKETLDEFIDAMIEIAREAKDNPDILKSAPHTTIVRRPDETRAARDPILKYEI